MHCTLHISCIHVNMTWPPPILFIIICCCGCYCRNDFDLLDMVSSVTIARLQTKCLILLKYNEPPESTRSFCLLKHVRFLIAVFGSLSCFDLSVILCCWFFVVCVFAIVHTQSKHSSAIICRWVVVLFRIYRLAIVCIVFGHWTTNGNLWFLLEPIRFSMAALHFVCWPFGNSKSDWIAFISYRRRIWLRNP